MTNNKGFTLVELVAVIAILSIVLLISIPTLINNINDKKETSKDEVYELIKLAARNYEIDYMIEEETVISIQELCGRYISCPIINPSTNEEISGYITIGIDDYEIVED